MILPTLFARLLVFSYLKKNKFNNFYTVSRKRYMYSIPSNRLARNLCYSSYSIIYITQKKHVLNDLLPNRFRVDIFTGFVKYFNRLLKRLFELLSRILYRHLRVFLQSELRINLRLELLEPALSYLNDLFDIYYYIFIIYFVFLRL